MGKRSASDSLRVEHAVGRAVNYEVTLADHARRSERRAWWVAGTSCAISLILAGGYFYFLPLKEKVPYLVMADAYTGTATVARLDGNWGQQDITLSEAVNKSNVAHFVTARESYDIALMRLRDWTTVYTMSAPSVAAGYTALHGKDNPQRPYNTYGDKAAIRVKILSTTLISDASGRPNGATVRFQRTLYDKATGRSAPLDSKIATLTFTYKANLAMDEKYRIENPLGFQVTTYRVDNDYAESPPVEPEIPAFQMPDMGEPTPAAPTTVPAAAAQPVDAAAPATPAGSSPTASTRPTTGAQP
ncbi:type IV secretion system protein [Lysobacter sp. TY2-98]|uniref:virB8 family protein n=1 Tax=Lysobacter sp. TY2-98 TaxID=2290922 RepID=UPI000E20B14F|nr:type IV secretion system protein [Lysobacter sp. TY2-98]AXK72980.1 type IV secretion system protein [Lysobacter sp. TY2-98]